MVNKAKFSVVCDQMGFSRSAEIPMDSRGYAHQLADDMERAMKFYKLRASNHEMKQAIMAVLGYLDSWGSKTLEEHEPEKQAHNALKLALEKAES